MTNTAVTMNLYLLNSALLFTHEIDSAFWKEWELFGMPGGVQVFLLLNFLLVLAVLWGFKRLLQGTSSGLLFSLFLAASGILAFLIHSCLILAGHPEFTLPVSMTILVSLLIVSLVQGFVTIKEL